MNKAVLMLEDGTYFEGGNFGASGESFGEVVFHTGMSGYQEILTDPSYHEQIVTMTYPLIGNYGANKADAESRKIFLKGFIVKENCPYPSNWRNKLSLDEYLKESSVVGLAGIDTRALVRHLRDHGAKKGIISTVDFNRDSLLAKVNAYPGIVGRDITRDVTIKRKYEWKQGVKDVITGEETKVKLRFKVAALDLGIKQNILRLLYSAGCAITVFPAQTGAAEILKMRPSGLFISNGPGDPEPVEYAVTTVRNLLGRLPVFGICQGHHILTLALGGKTYKLKFGHHGANHPVKNLKTGAVEITSQNHGFCADMNSLKGKDVEITHLNLNDNTVEGIRCKKVPAFAVQYHPEASPGPHDSLYLFNEFIKMMSKK